MSEALSNELDRLERAFKHIERKTPFLKPVANAFKAIALNRAVLKAMIAERSAIGIPPPDRSRFIAGYPWLTGQAIASCMDPWGETVKSTMPPLTIAFPTIAPAALRLRDAFDNEDVDLGYCTSALVEGREDVMSRTAFFLGIRLATLKFILGQMLKPFVEKRTEILRPTIRDLPWRHGYCPICGAFPELSFLQREEGERWLRCSLCAYGWRFDRIFCPHCGKQNRNKEFIRVDGAEHEWVELCPDCRKYIVGIDMRKHADLTIEVAALGMVHLDIVARQKGYLPMAECAWNLVSPNN